MRGRGRNTISKKLTGTNLKYWLLFPLLLWMIVGMIAPLVQLLCTALSNDLYTNIVKIFIDKAFWHSLWVTLIYVSVSVGLQFFFGLTLALLTEELEKPFIRSIFLIPFIVSPIAVGVIWRLIYHPMFGILNIILGRFGIMPKAWLADPSLALFSIVVVDVWQYTSFVYLLLLAGLKVIPKNAYEAALIDGASRWETIKYITLPLLKPVITVTLLLRSMDAFKSLDKVVALTNGGPVGATELLSFYIYRISFQYFKYEKGALLAVVAVLFVILFNKTWRRIFKM